MLFILEQPDLGLHFLPWQFVTYHINSSKHQGVVGVIITDILEKKMSKKELATKT